MSGDADSCVNLADLNILHPLDSDIRSRVRGEGAWPVPRRPSMWVANRPLTTGRLAWLAARPELERRSSPWWAVPLRIITASGRPVGTRFASELRSEVKSGRMARYAFPVDTVAGRLSKDEEVALRETGTLPDWFFDAVEAERKARRRLRRQCSRHPVSRPLPPAALLGPGPARHGDVPGR